MNSNTQKLIIGAGLFGAWFALVAFNIQNSADIIEWIKPMLVGLGGYHMGGRSALPNVGATDAPKY